MPRARKKKVIEPNDSVRTGPFLAASQMKMDHEMPLDHVAEALFVRPGRIRLRFADGFEGTWTFRQLGLNMSKMVATTIKASTSGNYVEVKSKWGEDVQLDSSSLRVMVDPKYAIEIENKLNILAGQIGL